MGLTRLRAGQLSVVPRLSRGLGSASGIFEMRTLQTTASSSALDWAMGTELTGGTADLLNIAQAYLRNRMYHWRQWPVKTHFRFRQIALETRIQRVRGSAAS